MTGYTFNETVFHYLTHLG